MADWSKLAQDVLKLIISKLELSDYHRFGVVCQNWRAAAKAKHYCPANHLPWLILGEDMNTKKRVFFSLLEKKHYYMDIPELYGHFCLGSSYGWLFTIDEEIDGHLLNPLTHEYYKLPPFPADSSFDSPEDPKALQGKRRHYMQRNIVRKAILSDNPSKTCDFTVAILFGYYHNVMFWRPGDPNWSVVNNSYDEIQDVTFFQGILYGVVGCYTPVMVDLGPDPMIILIHLSVRIKNRSKEAYLVNIDDEFLLLIQRIEAEPEEYRYLYELDDEDVTVVLEMDHEVDYYEDEEHLFVTEELSVFELDFKKEKYCEWGDINGSAFFLGRGSHIAVDPAQVVGSVSNRISYSGFVNKSNGFDNVGFYDMLSETVGEYNPSKDFMYHAVSPAWFIPHP